MITDTGVVAPVLLGAIIIALVFQDVFEVLLLPRRVRRRWRLAGIFFIATWAVYDIAAMMAAILMLAVIATVLDSAIMVLRRWVTRWAETRGDAQ